LVFGATIAARVLAFFRQRRRCPPSTLPGTDRPGAGSPRTPRPRTHQRRHRHPALRLRQDRSQPRLQRLREAARHRPCLGCRPSPRRRPRPGQAMNSNHTTRHRVACGLARADPDQAGRHSRHPQGQVVESFCRLRRWASWS
jgi:hypothetical protein